MPTLVISDVEENIARRLRQRAAEHGRTIEAEARSILADALSEEARVLAEVNMADAIREMVEPVGGIELAPFPDEPAKEPLRLD